MKKYLILGFSAFFLAVSLPSCKAIARAAGKRWARKKRKEWLQKCNDSALGRFGERGKDFCDCALDVVMEKYPDAEDGLALTFFEIIKTTKDCITSE